MIGRMHLRWLILLLVGGLFFSPLAGEVPAAELRMEMTTFLNQGWNSSYKSYLAAERDYERLVKLFPTDVRVPYAMALVAIKHRRYATALEHVNEMLTVKPHLWIGQRTKLWLLVILDKDEAALEQAVFLGEQLMADKKLDKTQRDERAAWIGRMFAYIAAPTGDDLPEEMIVRYENRLLFLLDEQAVKAFDEGRSKLLTDFSARKFEHEQVQAQEKVEGEKKKVEQTQELALEKDQTNVAAGDIEAQANNLRDQLQADLNKIDAALGDRQDQLVSVQQQASIVLRTLDQLAVNIDAVRFQLDSLSPGEVIERGRLLAILRSWEIDYANQAAIYRPLAIQGQTLENEIATLNGQRQQTINQFNAQMNQLGRTLTNLQRRVLRIQQDERKLAKTTPTGYTPWVRANDMIITALTTYEPFPVEQDKQTILRSLK